MQEIRNQFPALQRLDNGLAHIFLDGPAGTQVPEGVIGAMQDYYRSSNSNTHGQFVMSRETDALMSSVRHKCAVLLNAPDASCISFGQNMTTLAFSLSRAFSRIFQPGDEVVVTQLDHEANRGPWLALEEMGVVVKEIALLPTGLLDYEDAVRKITVRTRLVAAGWASNILGTVNDLQILRDLSRAVGAWLLVDAVHYAPHFPPDVQAIDCDFLLCSAYKFYGPHVGILYCRAGMLDMLPTDRLRTAGQEAPERIETGTLNHAALAGVGASIDFISGIANGETERESLVTAFQMIHSHEHILAKKLFDGLSAIPGITIYGPPFDDSPRAPTLAFTIDGITPTEACRYLAAHNINAWDGHFYAVRTVEVLGLEEMGGVTRMGVVAYNTQEEIEHTLDVTAKLASVGA